MKTVITFWTISIALVTGLLFWRNSKRYAHRPISFRLTKTLAEFVLIFLSAWRLPALLGAWIGLWLTKPIRDPRIKVTVGVLIAGLIGFCSVYVMELVILAAVFAVDGITGTGDGFLSDWKKAKWADLERKNFHQKVA
jgi:hypothetical protein